METIVIATDFSAAASHAMAYAAQMATALGIRRLILYHSYHATSLGSNELVPQVTDYQGVCEKQLEADKERLIRTLPDGIAVETRTNDKTLLAESGS